MPGWGIAADLTPPELINTRELRTLRKWIYAGLVLLLVACIGAYVAGARQHSAASAALDKVNAQTVRLQAGERKYTSVTRIQGSVSQVQAQIAALMGSDVDLVKLLGRLRSALPPRMTISSESVTVNSGHRNRGSVRHVINRSRDHWHGHYRREGTRPGQPGHVRRAPTSHSWCNRRQSDEQRTQRAIHELLALT